MKINADGSKARPTTDDTLRTFVQQSSKTRTCLVISNDPFTLCQTLTARRLLAPHGYIVEGAGDGKFHYEDIRIVMDEFARALYEMKQATV